MLPLLEAGSARNWARDNNIIAQEILLLSLAIAKATSEYKMTITFQYDTEVVVNGIVITGSVMTNDDITGAEYYAVWAEQTIDQRKLEQFETIKNYFRAYGYSIDIVSSNGTSIGWKLSW